MIADDTLILKHGLHPTKTHCIVDEDDFGHGRTTLDRELQFFDRVKQRLRSREAYQDLLKCMNMFAHDIISRGELVGLVQDIIGRFPDLMVGICLHCKGI